MPTHIGRARTLLAALMTTAVVLAGCSAPGLSVLEWSGYDKVDFWTDFSKANPNTKVKFEFGASDSEILGKFETGNAGFDIVHFYTGWQQFYVDKGLVKEIDTSKLKNWDKVSDAFKKLGQVNGKQYYVPWDWGFSSIIYNTSKVQGEITSWSALFDKAYAGHISMWDDGPGAVTVGAYIHGWDETNLTADQLATIEKEWIAQKPLNKAYWVSEFPDLCDGVASGDIWVAYDWQGCYAQTLYDGKVPVAYATPVEGRNSWVGLYGISSKSSNYDLALQFLDDKLATLTCSNAVTKFYYGCANQDVMKGVTDPVLIKAFSLNDPAILQHTNFTPPVTDTQRTAWTELWARVKASTQ